LVARALKGYSTRLASLGRTRRPLLHNPPLLAFEIDVADAHVRTELVFAVAVVFQGLA